MIRRNFVSSISAFCQQTFPIKRKHEFLVIKSGRREQAWIAVLAYLMKCSRHGCHYNMEFAAEDSRRYSFEMLARLCGA